MSLESSLEDERLKVLKVLHNHGLDKSLSGNTELDESTLRDLSLNDKKHSDVDLEGETKEGFGDVLNSVVSVDSSLSGSSNSDSNAVVSGDSLHTNTSAVPIPSNSNYISTTSPIAISPKSTSTSIPSGPRHKHSISLILNDGNEEVKISGSPKQGSPLRTNFSDEASPSSSNQFTAESLFEPSNKLHKTTSPKAEPQPQPKHKEPHKETYKDLIFSTSKLDSAPRKLDSRGRSRGRSRSHTDDYDSDDAAIDGLFDITQYKSVVRGPSFSGDHLINEHSRPHNYINTSVLTNNMGDNSTLSNTINNTINTTNTTGSVPTTVTATTTTINHPTESKQPAHLAPTHLQPKRRNISRSRSPVSRLPVDNDYDYYDDTDEEYETESDEEDEEEEEEEFVYEDIDSSETSDEENLTAEDIKARIDSEEKPPGFKEGSALTGPVLSNSKRIRRPSELDASLVPTNTMSLLAAIEAEQSAVSALTTAGTYQLRNNSISPSRLGRSPSPHGRAHGRAQSPQQAEYAAYKRRIIHPNTAFDVKKASANGGGYDDIDIPYTSDHEEVRDAQRAAQLHMEISQIHSNTETRRMYRTMTRGNLPALDEEDTNNTNNNLPPLKSFIVATDLSPEATHALEWTIGTVLRDGNLLIIVCAFEEDGPTDPQSEELTRLEAMDKITASTVKLLKKTRLQVHVALEVLHCKSARHALTDITDHVSPTLVILGSRGRSALKGVLLGSFSNYIVERSSVPVMVARRKLQKTKNKGLNVRLANNLRHGTLTTAKID